MTPLIYLMTMLSYAVVLLNTLREQLKLLAFERQLKSNQPKKGYILCFSPTVFFDLKDHILENIAFIRREDIK